MISPGWLSMLLEFQMNLWNEGTVFAPHTAIRSFVRAQSLTLKTGCSISRFTSRNSVVLGARFLLNTHWFRNE